MITLSYSTNGLTNLDLLTTIDQLENAGYGGIEITFQKDSFNPFTLTDVQILNIHQRLQSKNIQPVCISTPTMYLLGAQAHEPSVISLNTQERLRRVNLIKKGLVLAKDLQSNIVTFGSGFIREEHVRNPQINPMDLLLDSIKRMLEDIDDKVVLVIEPEPGMFIETMDDAIKLVTLVNSPNFKLHLDLCHVFCTEQDYLKAIDRGMPYTKYFHISDASQGYNLKIVTSENTQYDFNFASYMVYFHEYDCFLMLTGHQDNHQDAHQNFCFYTKTLSDEMINKMENFIHYEHPIQWINYNNLTLSKQNEDEIHTYLNSIPKLSFDLLNKLKPILHYLRDSKPNTSPIIKNMLSNTLTGKVHFHDIPGSGEIDFESFFNILKAHHFSGATTLELYHHVNDWKNAMNTSIKQLQKYL